MAKILQKVLLALLSIMLCTNCSNNRNYDKSSRATGWPAFGRQGGSKKIKAKEQETGPGLVFIEGGTFTMGRVQDDPMGDWNNVPTQQHVQSFYMDETEVTNLMYLEYIDWLKKVFPPTQENFRKIYEGALPDTLVWKSRLGYNETMVDQYFRHPAFAEYPVVGVSWVQAVEFSKWRTDRVNELILEEEGFIQKNARYQSTARSVFNTETYLKAPTLTYGGNDSITRGSNRSQRLIERGDSTQIFVRRKDGILLPAYRLPTEAEWEYAALGLVGIRYKNTYRGRKKYPWNGPYTRSQKRKNRGDQLANFKQGAGDYSGIAGWSDDGAGVTAQVKSYEANDFGLYDMAGNVAEWVADVYRPIIDDEYNDFNYFRGNVYMKPALDDGGNVQIITPETMVYDTLPNGKVVARKYPGELKEEPIGKRETFMRINFSKSDNRNYRDGDRLSLRYNPTFSNAVSENNKRRMYNSPINKLVVAENGSITPQYDRSSTRNTLISNETRVYKGGSWKDREYWLDPAQRRYLPQYMATNYIGFRCAMSRVGAKSKKKNKRATH
ncbi:gliding motility lipoprotein GldJ [Marixanthomonas spongiae]|uniref:Gliding motility lipoprotein GldJ n=1 Tax=Marixanthomonas spongiae TaxID=2174845 RepID=A0A2U0HWQ2_9FLAO|nr:gliding motility lipoprotein GldJ [Marixanthomonas spongiae]PVW13301.1 gliding motility lipoprotein GldJ [Marixanthomonas spongiae]